MKLTKEQRDLLARLGSEGGKKGGKARWEGTAAKDRSAEMSRVAKERWKKRQAEADR